MEQAIAPTLAASAELDEQTIKIKELMVDYLVKQHGIDADVASNGQMKVEDLNIDSLSMVEMLYEVEDKFGIHVEHMSVLKDMTIDSLVTFLRALANKPVMA